MPVESIGSAAFTHRTVLMMPSASMPLIKESTLDVISAPTPDAFSITQQRARRTRVAFRE